MKLYNQLKFGFTECILIDSTLLHLDPQYPNYHYQLKEESLNWKFLEILKSKNLKVYIIEVFITDSNNKSWVVHTDLVKGFEHNNIPKINWVYGNTNCPMVWYKEKNESKELKQQITPINTLSYSYKDINNLEKIDEVYIADNPCIVQAGIPHTVYNNNGPIRYCVSITLIKKLDNANLNHQSSNQTNFLNDPIIGFSAGQKNIITMQEKENIIVDQNSMQIVDYNSYNYKYPTFDELLDILQDYAV
jgi:hypothetical protein